jgi:hypothetical protein
MALFKWLQALGILVRFQACTTVTVKMTLVTQDCIIERSNDSE